MIYEGNNGDRLYIIDIILIEQCSHTPCFRLKFSAL